MNIIIFSWYITVHNYLSSLFINTFFLKTRQIRLHVLFSVEHFNKLSRYFCLKVILNSLSSIITGERASRVASHSRCGTTWNHTVWHCERTLELHDRRTSVGHRQKTFGRLQVQFVRLGDQPDCHHVVYAVRRREYNI